VFASLGKVVSIGQLSVDVSDCSVKTLRKKFQAIFLKAQNFTGQGFDFEQFTEGFDILNPCFAVVLATNNKSENYKASGFNIFLNKKPFAVFAEGFLYL
jgi:hypothetical protein